MGRLARAAGIGLLLLAACESREEPAAEPPPAAAENAATAGAANEASAPVGLADCPFRETSEWVGSVEGGRVLVNGRVDLMMAGMRPTLTERSGGRPGTLALELALTPEPQAAVNDRVRYEARGTPRRAVIWCGGEPIAEIDMIMVE